MAIFDGDVQRRLLGLDLHQHRVCPPLQKQLYSVVLAKLTGTVECSFSIAVALVHQALRFQQDVDYFGMAIGPAIYREEKGCPHFEVRTGTAVHDALHVME